MAIDLTNLTPAKWEVLDGGPRHYNIVGDLYEDEDGEQVCTQVASVFIPNNSGQIPLTNAAFIALARNAFAGDKEALAWWEANRTK